MVCATFNVHWSHPVAIQDAFCHLSGKLGQKITVRKPYQFFSKSIGTRCVIEPFGGVFVLLLRFAWWFCCLWVFAMWMFAYLLVGFRYLSLEEEVWPTVGHPSHRHLVGFYSVSAQASNVTSIYKFVVVPTDFTPSIALLDSTYNLKTILRP